MDQFGGKGDRTYFNESRQNSNDTQEFRLLWVYISNLRFTTGCMCARLPKRIILCSLQISVPTFNKHGPCIDVTANECHANCDVAQKTRIVGNVKASPAQ